MGDKTVVVRAALLALCALVAACAGQNHDIADRVAIQSASWLEGRWVGPGLNGVIEERWAAAENGRMTGYFQLTHGDQLIFAENQVLEETGGTLTLRSRAISAEVDGRAGEQRIDDWNVFHLQDVATNALHFENLRMRRIGEDELEIFLRIPHAGGETHETTFVLRRAR